MGSQFIVRQNKSRLCRSRIGWLAALAVCLLGFPLLCFGWPAAKSAKNSDRPKLPYNMMGLQPDDVDAYDSKAEPVAEASAALVAMNNAGWTLIRKYFPQTGTPVAGRERPVNPDDHSDNRFFASYATEDVAYNPIPLLCMIWSLPASEVSGRLKALHDEIVSAMTPENYATWSLDDLRKSVAGMTNPAKTAQGTKYRTPKSNFSFQQALRLYAMTLALLKAETKWAGKTDSPPPDMIDFTNRLRQQLPQPIRDGETIAFFLYRPGVVNHPLSKDEFDERADVAQISRKGTTFEVLEFPVYLTEDQKEWSPSWIQPEDEQNDTTLTARKFEHDWTRLDGPFLWFRSDQLNGQVTYRATVKLNANEIVIEAERMIESRGAAKRVDRPADYDPKIMAAFQPGMDTPAGLSDPFTIDPPKIEDEVRNLKRLGPYFSNSFRAWCAYGLATSGRAADGKTWVAVPPDEPRSGAPASPLAPGTATVSAHTATQR